MPAPTSLLHRPLEQASGLARFTRKGGSRRARAPHHAGARAFSGRYVIERDNVFDERFDPADQPLIDRLFRRSGCRRVSGSVIRDTRDDALAPSRGELRRDARTSAGARAIGSEVGFIKLFTQGLLFRRAVARRRGASSPVARGRASPPDSNGRWRKWTRTAIRCSVLTASPSCRRDTDLPASERFFAGGDTSVRGYALDRLGTAATIDRNGFPVGGNAVIVLNSELRVPVWKDVGVVGFIDAGNACAARVSDFGVRRHPAHHRVWPRYKSPNRPAARRSRLQARRARRSQTAAFERLTALHISLGQAF